MSSAIGSRAISGAGGYMSRVALRAELTRYQKQLSDSINCSSAKTLEGKAHIQELSGKISVDQRHIRQIEAAGTTAHDPSASNVITTATVDTYSNAGATIASSSQAEGELVNVFA